MSKPHMRPPARLNLADPAAVAAWVGLVRGKVDGIKPLVLDATEPKSRRTQSRHHLRAGMLRQVRDLGILLDALVSHSEAPAVAPTERAADPDVRRDVPCVFAREEQEGDTWHRWIELRFLWQGSVYGFKADASALTFDAGTDAEAAIRSPDFAPCVPDELTVGAVTACRAVALRLHAAGIERSAVTGPWPADRPTFASLVRPRVVFPTK